MNRIKQICERYESGYGHGIKNDGLDLSRTPHSDPELGEAYQYGYEQGREKSAVTPYDPGQCWYVVWAPESGKFDDGYYGWDGNLHSDCQIHAEDELPYGSCDLVNILVGMGRKPNLQDARDAVETFLKEHGDA
jgi:hypothetical protein